MEKLPDNGANKLSKNNKNQEEVLVGEDLNASLFEAIQTMDGIRVKYLIDYVMQNNKSIDLKNLKAAISQGDPEIIELIIPHCGFSKPSDQYISKELMIAFGYDDCVKLLLNWNFTVNPDSKQDKEFIYAAVEEGYLPIVLQLLELGIDVDMVDSDTGLNLLTVACLNEHHEIVEILLKHGADANVIIPSTNWSLWRKISFFRNSLAVANFDPTITKLLLKYGAKILDDPKLFNVTSLAIKTLREDIFRIFLDYGVNATDIGPQGKTFLHSCVESHFSRNYYYYCCTEDPEQNPMYKIAKWLLENGADIHLQTPGNSLVFQAIKNGHNEIAQLFLEYNPDVQYVSTDGNTALNEAIKNYDYNIEFIKILLKLNSPVNIVDSNGHTPLIIAFTERSKDQLEIVKALLDHNANVNFTDGKLITPLHFACDKQCPGLVTLLLEKGANPNATNINGETLLHYVCKQNSKMTTSIIKLCLQHDANVEAKDAKGWTPLFIACEKNNYAAVKLLLENNAYANHQDFKKLTPLHISVKKGFVDVINCLIEHGGANIDISINCNRTPLQLAKEYFSYCGPKFDFRGLNPCIEGNYLGAEKINIYNNIIEILQCHAVKLRTAGLQVIQRINWRTEHKYKARFEEEIEHMKMENFSTANITFYDLLTKNIHFRSRFVRNEIILETLENDLYNKKFPFYINIVRSRFREAIIRYNVMNSAREYFRKNVCENLPDECIDLIFSYLSIDQLFIFIGTTIPLNGIF